MPDRVLTTDEMRKVLRLLYRELGVTPVPWWRCLPACARCGGHNGHAYGPGGGPWCLACREAYRSDDPAGGDGT